MSKSRRAGRARPPRRPRGAAPGAAPDFRGRFAETERRLAEAEQTLAAIRSGAVDALVVSTAEGEQVFTLQGAERPYRILMEAMSAGAATLAPDGTILYANTQLAEMLRLPLEQVIGAVFERFVADEDCLAFQKLMAEANDTATAGEVQVRRAGAENLPVHLSLRLPEDPSIRAACLVVTDLTERKRTEETLRRLNEDLERRVRERTLALEEDVRRRQAAEEALRVQEHFARKIVESSLTGTYIYDLEAGRHVYLNPMYERITGHTLATFEAMDSAQFFALFHPDDQARIAAHQERVREASNGDTLEIEYRFQRADGQWIWCLSRDTVFERDPQGRVRQLIGSFLDITARKRAEKAVQAAEQRLRHFLQAVPIGVIRWSMDGAILDANAHFLEMVGYIREDLQRGRLRWDDMTPPQWRQRTEEALAELRASGRAYPFEKAYRRKDGSPVPILVSSVMIDPVAGQATSFVLDLTEQKRAEAGLRQALAAKEAALADNVALLREVHHRTKNNLQMLCDLLYLQAATLDSAKAKDVLQEAYGRILAIARLHEQLYQSLERGQIRLGEYLGRLVQGFKGVYTTVSITLDAPAERLALDVDRAIPLGLIVNELVTNALKHAFPEGATGEIGIGLQEAGDRIRLRVWDNGRGLPAKLKIEECSSLGLRLVRILAQRLRAEITVESNHGTAFSFTFPSVPEEETMAAESARPAGDQEGPSPR